MDEKVHEQFIRFGKGNYVGKALISLHKTSRVKVKGSYEYANDFVLLVAELGGVGDDVKFSGAVLSKQALELEGEKKKAGLYVYEVSDLSSEKVKEISEKAYFMLLDGKGEGINLKIKKRLPKPGRSGESKVDDKFCQLEADLNFFNAIREAFFWDAADCKKVKAEHTYEIKELVMPEISEGEKDFEKARLMAKRKGLLVRKLEVDGREEIKEREFEV